MFSKKKLRNQNQANSDPLQNKVSTLVMIKKY